LKTKLYGFEKSVDAFCGVNFHLKKKLAKEKIQNG
jgi:hypothetical protein